VSRDDREGREGRPVGGRKGAPPNPDAKALREALRQARKARPKDGTRPEWRERLDAIVDDAVGQVIERGVTTHPDGRVDVTFDRRLAATHGLPALTAVLDGVRESLMGAGLPAAEAPSTPLGAMTAGLRQNLAGLVGNVRTGLAGEPPPPADPAGQPVPLPDPRELVAGLVARVTAAVPPVSQPPEARTEGPPEARRAAPPTVSLDVAGLFGALLGGLQRAVAEPPRTAPVAPPTPDEESKR
jgi:hypothetical protein